MKSSNIGGQAVMEGIMMRHEEEYSIAVRTPDNEIKVKVEPYKSFIEGKKLRKVPIVRGVISFIDSLVVGMKCLLYSASFIEEDEEEKAERAKKEQKMTAEELERHREKEKKQESAMMYGVVALSVVLAVAVFMMLPYFLTDLMRRVTDTVWILSITEALVRVAIFLAYLILISRMKDIQRTFMYHGAEHKCINCIEHGMELNVENVLKSSRLHKRCGTSFLFFVIIVSAILLMFVQMDSRILRIVVRLLLVPVIAGVSFEIIRLAGRSENPFVNALSKPGLALQRLTTREPDAAAGGSGSGESGGDLTKLVVGASPTPHAEILSQVREALAEAGYELEIREFTDYVMPNTALEEGDLDANGTHLVSAGAVHYEPMGIFAGKTDALEAIPDGGSVAVPNDPTNEARALLLLEANGILKLKEGVGLNATKLDIAENPKNLEIQEVEAAQLCNMLPDVDVAVINGNYAIQGGLKVSDALAAETADSEAAQTFANIVAVREGNEEDPGIQALIQALQSEAVKTYIDETYEGAVVAIF